MLSSLQNRLFSKMADVTMAAANMQRVYTIHYVYPKVQSGKNYDFDKVPHLSMCTVYRVGLYTSFLESSLLPSITGWLSVVQKIYNRTHIKTNQ